MLVFTSTWRNGPRARTQLKWPTNTSMMKLPSCAVLEDGRKMVSVPLDALNVAIASGKAALAEKKALTLELAQLDAEALALEANLHKRQDQLERCASFRPDLHRPRAKSSPRAFFSRDRSKTSLLSASSIRDLLGEQAEELSQLLLREENVRFSCVLLILCIAVYTPQCYNVLDVIVAHFAHSCVR